MRLCENCGYESADEETKFCPKCGAELSEQAEEVWQCGHCGQENPADSRFCKSCGNGRTAANDGEGKDGIQGILRNEHFKVAVIAAIVVLLGGLGSYFYFSGVNEERYLAHYAEASRQIGEANALLVGNVKVDLLKNAKSGELGKQLAAHRAAIDEAAANFSQRKPFKDYASQQSHLVALLQKESAILEKTAAIAEKPLESSTDIALDSLKNDIDTAKELSAQISVPNANFALPSNLADIFPQLQAYVRDTRKANKEKMDKLAKFQAFFKKMDEAIQRYDAAREKLGKMMDSQRSGIIWADYFNILDNAKFDRNAVRNTVDEIEPPAGTEALKTQFMGVLDEAIRYCSLKRVEANMRFNKFYGGASKHEKEAEEVNQAVQSMYAAFIERYNAEKARLTNFANM